MRPRLSAHLASYPDREEFQIDRVIVWVRVSAEIGSAASVSRAESVLGQVWEAIPQVLVAAQDASRQHLPQMWQAYDAAGVADQQLAVYGIWIDPLAASADYDVAWNYDKVNPEGLPKLPDDHRIAVTRDAAGTLTVDPVA